MTEFYTCLNESDYPVLVIKFENVILDVVSTLNGLNEESLQLRKNLAREQSEKEQQVSRDAEADRGTAGKLPQRIEKVSLNMGAAGKL